MAAGLLPKSTPIFAIFFGCCASALAPHTVSVRTIAKSPIHFGFSILRLSSGQVLDFRLSEQESKNRFKKVLFTQFLQSKIENRQSKMSSYDPIRPRQHIGRNREPYLVRGLEIDDERDLIDPLHREVLGFNTSKNALDVLR